MIDSVKSNWQSKVVLFLFIVFSVWWLSITYTNDPESNQGQIFAAVYGVVALWGGVWGVLGSKAWGGWKSLMGRSMLMFSFGLLAQEFGQLSYSYYIYFLKIEVPYPSIGDIGYFGSIPLYIYGIWLLAKASGAHLSLKSATSKLQLYIIPVLMLGVGYLLFLKDYEFDWSSPLTIFLDFGYPLGQAIYIAIAILTYSLSRGLLGGIMKSKILFIIFALCTQFLADYTFLYQASKGTWSAGGINDYIYLISYTLMALSLFQLKSTAVKISKS